MSLKNIINPITKPGLKIELNNLKLGNVNYPNTLGSLGSILMSDGSDLVFGANVKNLINSAIYRPGGVSSGNVFSLWSEVVDFINATNGDVLLYMDDSIVSPCVISSNIDLQSRVQIVPYRNNIDSVKVKINDGVIISNIGYIGGPMDILASPTLAIPFNIGSDGSFLLLSMNVKLQFDGVPTLPFMEVSGSNNLIIGMFRGCSLDNSLSPGSPLFKISDTATGIVASVLGSDYGTDTISGVVGTNLLLVHDASSVSPTLSGFLGTRLENIFDKSESVSYDDSIVPNLVPSPSIPGSPSVGDALNGIKSLLNNTLNCNDIVANTLTLNNQTYLSMYQTTTQSVNNTTLDLILFDAVNGSNIGGIVYNAGVFTIPSNGVYTISFAIVWAPALAGTVTSYVERTNSSTYNHLGFNFTSANNQNTHVGSFTTELIAGDTLKYFVYQTSGLALNFGSIGAGTSKISIVRLY